MTLTDTTISTVTPISSQWLRLRFLRFFHPFHMRLCSTMRVAMRKRAMTLAK